MKTMIAALLLGMLMHAVSQEAARSTAYEFENLKFHIVPPADYMRVDDTDTDIAEMIKAGVPASNHLFAAYSSRSNILGRKGGAASSGMPYFMLQAVKRIVTGKGVAGFTTKEFLEDVSKMANLSVDKLDPNGVEKLRTAVNEKAKIRHGDEFVKKVGMTPIGTVSKSDTHTTILVAGWADTQSEGVTVKLESMGTMTVLNVNALPLLLYVFVMDDGTEKSVKEVIKLTDGIRVNITK